jgi:phosphoribosylformylglycinamidine synthase subunit PurQ / glutaminase
MRPVVFVLYAPGINCHFETADAFRLAGGNPEIRHLTGDLLTGKKHLWECDLLAVPGGFSFGDHLGAGKIFALDLIARLSDQLSEARSRGIPMIGICNGFQILVNTGLLPGGVEIGKPTAIVDRNRSARYESRWVTVHVQPNPCLWTRGLEGEALRIPVAHGEGRLMLPKTFDDSHTVFRYGTPNGTSSYPENPNGSSGGRAGICDPSGRILGLMPHPERAIYPWLGSVDGLKIFQTGLAGVKS